MSVLDRTQIRRTATYYNITRRIVFPSMKKIVLMILIANPVGCASTFLLNKFTLENLFYGIAFGLCALALPSILADLLARALLRDDPLFYLRRCFALSLFSCLVWISFLLIGGCWSLLSSNFVFPDYGFYIGLFVVFFFRFLAIFSMSSKNNAQRFIFSNLQPALCLMGAVSLFHLPIVPSIFAFTFSELVTLPIVLLLLSHVERQGLTKLGMSPLGIFKAFLVDWLDWKNELIESYLEKLGHFQPITTTLISFRKKSDRSLKGIIVVSNFHPGPLLNIGSSILPQMIQKTMEDKTGAVVSVPHGVSGHELNLVSQKQNEMVIEKLMTLLGSSVFSGYASRLIQSQVGSATASCQVFGNLALLALTLSPANMDDIPFHMGPLIVAEGKAYFENVSIVDAHNCISDVTVLGDPELRDLAGSAKAALSIAAKEPKSTFKVGVAKVDLGDFTLGQGIGPGGLVVLLVETQSQLAAYITIDGNNMVTGLRERVLKMLDEVGIDLGEIMTTDTHLVNGLVAAKLGYHPVGEAVDQAKLINYVKSAILQAKSNLEEVEVSWSSSEVEVKTLGPGPLHNIVDFLRQAAKLVVASIALIVAAPIVLLLVALG